MNERSTLHRSRRFIAPVALVAGGLVLGGILVGTLSANAATGASEGPRSPASSYSSSGSAAPGQRGAAVDESKSQRSDEKLLTGSTADKVRAAALAKYPGATILRVETDSDGVYEAHLTTSAGKRVTVEVGSDFTVTGEEAAGPGGGPGGGTGGSGRAGGNGPGGQHGPGQAPSNGQAPSGA